MNSMFEVGNLAVSDIILIFYIHGWLSIQYVRIALIVKGYVQDWVNDEV